MAFKNSLSLNKKLSKEITFGWLQELTPLERAEITILRLLRKTQEADLKLNNHDKFLETIKTVTRESRENYVKGKVSLKSLKENIVARRNKDLGIMKGQPFETIQTNDMEWFR